MTDTRVDVENGKYTWIVTVEGLIRCLRHGERWIEPGDFEFGGKALIALIHHAAQLRDDLGLALAVGREALSVVGENVKEEIAHSRPPTEGEIALIIRWRWPEENVGVTYGADSPQAKTMREYAIAAWKFFRGFP